MFKRLLVGFIEGIILLALLFASILVLNVYNGTIYYYLAFIFVSFCALKIIEHVFLKNENTMQKLLQITLPVLLSIVVMFVLSLFYETTVTSMMVLMLYPIMVVIMNCIYEMFDLIVCTITKQEVK